MKTEAQIAARKAYMKRYREENRERIAAQQKEFHRAWYQANREALREKAKQEYALNGDKTREALAAWASANPERVAARKKAWAEKNAERVAANRKKRYEANRDEYIAKAVAWNRENKARRAEIVAAHASANPDAMRIKKARRRALELAAPGDGYTSQDVQEILTRQQWRCVYCAASLRLVFDIDHVQPLVRGGANAPSNLQALCPTCNRKKGARDPIEFERLMALAHDAGDG